MEGKKFFIIDKKFAIIVLCIVLVVVLIVVIFARSHALPTSCAQLREEGKVNIQRNDPDYNAALDRNKDGIACNA